MNKDQDDYQTSVIKTKMDKRKKSDAEYQTIQLTETQDPENVDPRTNKEQSTVVDWNESTEQTEERVHAQPGRLTIGQMLVKKLRKPKKSSSVEGAQATSSAGSSPASKKKARKLLPAISDFIAPTSPVMAEYYFDDWNDKCLTPEFHEQPKKLAFMPDGVQVYSHRYLGEAFTVVQSVAEFFVSLVLEVLAFASRVTTRVVSGTLIRITELLLKPILVVVFNGIFLPVFVTVQNILKSVMVMLSPLLDLIQRLVGIVTIPIQSFRLVEIRYVTENHAPAAAPPKIPEVQEV